MMGIQAREVKRMDFDKLLGLGGWAAAVIGSILALVKAVRFWNSEVLKDSDGILGIIKNTIVPHPSFSQREKE